ncbi:MAG: methyl-accepting chemotaxis protein [Acholeplasmatales bacterium]|jgi:methyl-accepting chemotaxis protein|nr:methyl-accepting chemotaxis protein [Acholeplasmatales bacterium]
MKNFKIRTKLVFSVGALFLVTILVAIISIVSVDVITIERQKEKDFFVTERSTIQAITVSYKDFRIDLRTYFLNYGESITPSVLTSELKSLFDNLGVFRQHRSAKGQKFDSTDTSNASTLYHSLMEFYQLSNTYVHNLDSTIDVDYLNQASVFAREADLALAKLFDEDAESIKNINADNEIFTTTLIFVNLFLIAVELSFGVFIIIFLSKRIAEPINSLVIASNKIANGETTEIDIKSSNDEIGELITSFNEMINSIHQQVEIIEKVSNGNLLVEPKLRSKEDRIGIALKKMIISLNTLLYDVNVTASQLAISSRTIADGAINLAQGSTEQASSVEELYTTIERISNKTKDNAELTKTASRLMNTIDGNTKNSVVLMGQLVEAVKNVETSTEDIKHIINFINNIAFQTNILSLNASIEATNAGEHGKIFSVIAEEVRKLAKECAEAAKKTEDIITYTLEKTAQGGKIVDETQDSLLSIAEDIKRGTSIIEEIALASEEQSLAISQVNIGIEQVAQVVNYNSHTAEQSAQSSEQLAQQSSALKDSVSKFQIK